MSMNRTHSTAMMICRWAGAGRAGGWVASTSQQALLPAPLAEPLSPMHKLMC